MLERAKNPVLALELSRWYKNKTLVIGMGVMYTVMFYPALLFWTLFDSPIAYMLYLVYEGFYSVILGDSLYFSVDIPDRYFLRKLQYMVTVVLGVIVLVVPALAATSIVGERRRETLMLVQLSSLRPFDIVWGKIVASVAPVLFMAWVCMISVVLSSWNVRQLFFGVGGVLVFIVGAAFVVSAVSVLISTFAKSTAAAIIVSYGMALVVWLALGFAVHYKSFWKLLSWLFELVL